MNDLCERVRLTEMAVLDGETPMMPLDDARAHQQSCQACRDAVAQLRQSHVALARLPLEAPAVDLWPRLRPTVVDAPAARRREWRVIGVVAAVLVAWRIAQLAFESPLPVIATLIVQVLAAGLFVALLGDPFSIRRSVSELRQEGA
jgi:predicted anti-sigma-YlaC factor YlaD